MDTGNHPPLECRDLSPEWEEPLAAFFRMLEQRGDDELFHPHPLDAEEAKRRVHYEGKDLYYVLVEGKEILAYGMLRGWDEGYEMPSLGIVMHPSTRGAGLGRVFMHFLHAAARRKGARRIRLKVHPDNAGAIRLYEGLGYEFRAREAGQLVGILELR